MNEKVFSILLILFMCFFLFTCENPFYPFSIPYNEYMINVVLIDNVTDDSIIANPAKGNAGDIIKISYNILNIETYNMLTFTGTTPSIASVDNAGSGIKIYIINPTDATDGIITITGTFFHSEYLPDPITYNDSSTIINKTYGDSPFTNSITTAHSGTGAIIYESSNTTVATVDNIGTVTITGAGTTNIIAIKAGDSVYAQATNYYTLVVAPATLSIGTPSSQSRTLSPIDTTATFTVSISGFLNDEEANNVGISISGINGITFSGHNAAGNATSGTKTFTITMTYNGTQEFSTGSANINIIGLNNIHSSYQYTGGTRSTTVNIADGHPWNYLFTNLNPVRRIPVTQANIQEFNNYANTAGLNQHYILTESVTLATPAPGGSNWTAISHFSGSFDGGDNTITGLTINSNADIQGMFGNLGSSTVIQNLGLIDVHVVSGGIYIGGIVGISNGDVKNCYVSGTGRIESTNTETPVVGGVVGFNWGNVSNCYAIKNIIVSQPNNTQGVIPCAGGVVGYNMGNVLNCFATVNVTAITYAGGVVGFNSGNVSNCFYADGSITVTGNSRGAGGVVGDNQGIIINTYSTGSVFNNATSFSYAGGIVGQTYGDDNLVSNNVALNQSVIIAANYTYVGRVTTTNSWSQLENNYGRDGMTILFNSTSPKTTLDDSLTGIDGQTVFPGTGSGQYNNQSFWEGLGWDFNNTWIWNSSTGLPILRDMPGNPPQNHTSP